MGPEEQPSPSPTSPPVESKNEVTLFTPPDELSRALPVKVSYAVNRLFHVGGSFALEMLVESRGACLREVYAELVVEMAGHSDTIQLQCQGKRNGGFRCQKTYGLLDKDRTFPTSGQAIVTGHILCVEQDAIGRYEFEVRHTIIPSGQGVNAIINNYTLEGGSLWKGDTNTSIPKNGDDMLKQINHEPALMREVQVCESDWSPEKSMLAKDNEYEHPRPCPALTLETKECLVHVIDKDDIAIGRLPDNDLVLVDWHRNTSYDQRPTATVSRRHALLHHDSQALEIECNGYTMVNNRVVPKGQRVALASGRTSLDFGEIGLLAECQECPQRKNDRMCWNCLAHPVKSLVLKRKDGLSEVFLCVWQCCDLESVCPSLKGVTLYRRNGGFVLQTSPGGGLYNLEVGQKITLSNRESITISKSLKFEFNAEQCRFLLRE